MFYMSHPVEVHLFLVWSWVHKNIFEFINHLGAHRQLSLVTSEQLGSLSTFAIKDFIKTVENLRNFKSLRRTRKM